MFSGAVPNAREAEPAADDASPRWMSHPELVSGSVSESIKIPKQVRDVNRGKNF